MAIWLVFFLFEIPSLLSEWRKTRVWSLRVRYEWSNLIVGCVTFYGTASFLAVTVWTGFFLFWDSFVMLPCLPCLRQVNRQAGSEWHLSIFCWFSIHFILILRIKHSNWRGGLACVFSFWDSFAALGMTKDKGKVIASEVRAKQSYCWTCYLFMGLFEPCCDSLLLL